MRYIHHQNNGQNAVAAGLKKQLHLCIKGHAPTIKLHYMHKQQKDQWEGNPKIEPRDMQAVRMQDKIAQPKS